MYLKLFTTHINSHIPTMLFSLFIWLSNNVYIHIILSYYYELFFSFHFTIRNNKCRASSTFLFYSFCVWFFLIHFLFLTFFYFFRFCSIQPHHLIFHGDFNGSVMYTVYIGIMSILFASFFDASNSKPDVSFSAIQYLCCWRFYYLNALIIISKIVYR